MLNLRTIQCGAVLTMLVGAPAFLTSNPQPAVAADVQQALLRAVRNTNAVRTLVHRDTLSQTSPGATVSVSAIGREDEIGNRESDQEHVFVRLTLKNRPARTIHYSVKLVFLKGKTFYQSSQSGSQWHTRAGMSFPDPFLGGWKRARTTVKLPAHLSFVLVDNTGGQEHVRAKRHSRVSHGTLDVWFTTGSTPYVVRALRSDQTTGPRVTTWRTDIRYGPFNQPITIVPPSNGSMPA